MESLLILNLIAIWVILLLNLLLTLALARRLRRVAAAPPATPVSSAPGLPVGQPAPDFMAQTLEGEPVTLRTYAGRAVSFIFVAPNCQHCRRILPELQQLFPKARRARVELVLVSSESAERTRALLDSLGVTIPMLLAPPESSDLASQYNPSGGTPFYCFINEQAVVLSTNIVGSGEWPQLQSLWESVADTPALVAR